MPERRDRVGDWARIALGIIRLVNGLLGIAAPGILIRRLGGDPTASPVARYAFRLFGVRTVLLGAELLMSRGRLSDRTLRTAVIVHASDLTVAAWGAWRRELPPRTAAVTISISAVTTLLALLAWRGRPLAEHHAGRTVAIGGTTPPADRLAVM